VADRVTRDREGHHRNGHGRRAGTIKGVDLNGEKIEEMGEWQPDSPDLRILGRQTVENASGYDQVRLRIVMAERQSLAVVENCSRAACGEAERGQQF
jgi:hypothetical protein